MQADSAAHSLPNSMAEMLGLERVGFNGNDIGEHDSMVEQLHRICVSALRTVADSCAPFGADKLWLPD